MCLSHHWPQILDGKDYQIHTPTLLPTLTLQPRASKHCLRVSTPAHNCHTWHVSKCSYPHARRPPPSPPLCPLASLSPSLSLFRVLTHPSLLHLCMTSDCLFTGILHSPGSKNQWDADTFFERKSRYSSLSKLRKPNTLYSADGTSFCLQICYPNSHYLTDLNSKGYLYFCSIF